jgi:hypothetical protein
MRMIHQRWSALCALVGSIAATLASASSGIAAKFRSWSTTASIA